MNLLDSSAWIEFFQDGPNAETFAAIAADRGNLLVPTIVLFEVFKFVLRVKGEVDAGKVAAALAYDATLWTQDDDFAAIPGVRYFPKPRL